MCLVVSFCLCGCRQADGPLPVADSEAKNRLEDINKDFGNIAAGHAEASQDLSDDLRVFLDLYEHPDSEPSVTELAKQVASALPRTPLAEERGLELARQLWLSIASRELSEKQVETLQNDVRAALIGVGVADTSAQTIVAQVRTVQSYVTDRKRRWYEAF